MKLLSQKEEEREKVKKEQLEGRDPEAREGEDGQGGK